MKLPGLTSFMSTQTEGIGFSQQSNITKEKLILSSEQAGWQYWWEATKQVLPIYIAVHIAAFIITCLAVLFTLHDFQGNYLPLSTIWHSWNQWDTKGHFIIIATQGYTDILNTAFFPLYPILMRGLMFVGLSPLVSGLLISNVAGLFALIVLYQLVREDFSGEDAWRTVLYISLFPTAFFFIAAYNETLFLLLSLLSFYAIRHGRWWQAGICGFLACLTRSAGLFLLIPFAYEYWRQHEFQLKSLRIGSIFKQVRIDIISAALIPAGIAVFALYCYLISGDALAFSHVQAHWQRSLAAPWHGMWETLTIIRHSTGFLSFYSLRNLLDLLPNVFILILVVLTFVGPWRWPRAYWAYGLYAAALFLFVQLVPASDATLFPLQSTARFMLEIFPAFIMLAILGKSRQVNLYYLLIASSMGFFLLTQFLTGHWVV
jgi:Gpi18-like mannosyltransferase